MGYRGEDASRAPSDSRHQQPGQRYGQDDGYAPAGSDHGRHQAGRGGGAGYPDGEGYPRDNAYRQSGNYPQAGGYDYRAGGEHSAGDYQAGGYGAPGGYDQGSAYQHDPGYQQDAGYAQDAGYGQDTRHGQDPRYGQGADYESDGYGHQGGQGYGHSGSGAGYAGDYGDTGGYADNDWYGGGSGSGFGDAGGNPPAYTERDPSRGYSPPGPLALPAPPQAGPASVDGLAYTGQQEALDDGQYEPYPGYETVDDQQPRDGYAGSGGYPAQQGYDDYADPEYGQPGEFGPAPGAGADYDSRPGFGYDDTAVIDGNGEGFDDQDSYQQDSYQDAGGVNRGSSTRPGTGARRTVQSNGRPKPRKSRRRRTILVSGVSVLCLVVAVAAVYTFFLKQSSNNSVGNTASPTGALPSPGSTSAAAATSACVKQYGEYCHIEYRTDDPTPLSVSELFPTIFLDEKDKTSFQRIGTRTDTKSYCADAVFGQDLVTALQSGKCTQLLRASYVAGSGKSEIVGTIGVANLNTTNDAHYAGRVVGQNDFVAPLSTSKGIGSKLGQGTGVIESQYKGHYLILAWAEFANGDSPSTTAEQNQLERFESDLIADTVNIDLSERMVNGKPLASAN